MRREKEQARPPLKLVYSDQLRTGMVVVCVLGLGVLYVGRIHSEVTCYPLGHVLQTGVLAKFDLLYADQHRIAGDRIWHTYFYRQADAPNGPGVFLWPDLMPLTFDLAESSLPTRPGWLKPIELRLPPGQIGVVLWGHDA